MVLFPVFLKKMAHLRFNRVDAEKHKVSHQSYYPFTKINLDIVFQKNINEWYRVWLAKAVALVATFSNAILTTEQYASSL